MNCERADHASVAVVLPIRSVGPTRDDPARTTKAKIYCLFILVCAMRLCSSISIATNVVTFGGRKRAAG